MSIFESVQTWGQAEDVFDLVRVRRADMAGLDVELTARKDERFAIAVRKDGADPRIFVTHRVDVPGQVVSLANRDGESKDALQRLVAATEATRDGTVSCALNANGREMTVDIVATVYEDGFSRHQLNAAVMELAKARKTLLPRFDSLVASSKIRAQIDQVISETRPETEKPAPLGAPRRKGPAKTAETKTGATGPTRSAPQTPEPKATEVKPSSAKRFCTDCGEALTPGKSFCTNCGARV